MHARTAARAISAAAMAGGLAVAFGPAPAASAMPTFEEGSSASVGQLCQEAVATLASSETPPSTIEGLPGLRCGQAFGAAHVDDSEAEDEVEDSTFEAEDDDSDDTEVEVEDDADDETEVEDDGEHHAEDHGDDHDEFEAEDDDSDEDVDDDSDEDSDEDADDDEGEEESDS